jgi:hypothetical protein
MAGLRFTELQSRPTEFLADVHPPSVATAL